MVLMAGDPEVPIVSHLGASVQQLASLKGAMAVLMTTLLPGHVYGVGPFGGPSVSPQVA